MTQINSLAAFGQSCRTVSEIYDYREYPVACEVCKGGDVLRISLPHHDLEIVTRKHLWRFRREAGVDQLLHGGLIRRGEQVADRSLLDLRSQGR